VGDHLLAGYSVVVAAVAVAVVAVAVEVAVVAVAVEVAAAAVVVVAIRTPEAVRRGLEVRLHAFRDWRIFSSAENEINGYGFKIHERWG
jgi:hypothetical protein